MFLTYPHTCYKCFNEQSLEENESKCFDCSTCQLKLNKNPSISIQCPFCSLPLTIVHAFTFVQCPVCAEIIPVKYLIQNNEIPMSEVNKQKASWPKSRPTKSHADYLLTHFANRDSDERMKQILADIIENKCDSNVPGLEGLEPGEAPKSSYSSRQTLSEFSDFGLQERLSSNETFSDLSRNLLSLNTGSKNGDWARPTNDNYVDSISYGSSSQTQKYTGDLKSKNYQQYILRPEDLSVSDLLHIKSRKNPRKMNGYMFFCTIHSPILRNKYPDSNFREIGGLMGHVWRMLKMEEKESWKKAMGFWVNLKENPEYYRKFFKDFGPGGR